MFSIFYHLEMKTWFDWDYDINKYDIRGELIQTNLKQDKTKDDDDDRALMSAGSQRTNYADNADEIDKIEF